MDYLRNAFIFKLTILLKILPRKGSTFIFEPNLFSLKLLLATALETFILWLLITYIKCCKEMNTVTCRHVLLKFNPF